MASEKEDLDLQSVLDWIRSHSEDTEAMNMIYLLAWKNSDVSAHDIEQYQNEHGLKKE